MGILYLLFKDSRIRLGLSAALILEGILTVLIIEDEEALYYDYIERIADIYDDVDLQRYAIVVGDLNYAPAISRFVQTNWAGCRNWRW